MPIHKPIHASIIICSEKIGLNYINFIKFDIFINFYIQRLRISVFIFSEVHFSRGIFSAKNIM